MTITRSSGPALVLLLSIVPFANAEQGEDAIWTSQPTHVDRSKQTYERLPARAVARDSRVWIVVPQRIKVLDSRSFSAGDRLYEFANLRPVRAKRICQAVEGGRWACGRMAAIFLGNLVRGKRLLCDVEQGAKTLKLSHCVIGTRDVAAAIVTQGYGMAVSDEALLSVQSSAQKLAAKGLWRNPKCTDDFDGC